MAQLMVVIQRGGIGLFVRRHHVETLAQEIGVLIGDRLTGGTVDDNRVQQMVLFDQTNQAAQVQRLFRFGQLRAPVLEIQPVHVSQQGL